MQYAVLNGSCKAVQRLCDQGYGVNVLDSNGNAPLYYATDVTITRFLLDKGADVNAQDGVYGGALEAAASKGKKEVVKLFLDHGADPNTRGGPYGSVLRAAAFVGNKEVVQLLLDRGANADGQGGYYKCVAGCCG